METTQATCKTIQRKVYSACSRVSKFTTLSLLVLTCLLNAAIYNLQYTLYSISPSTPGCLYCGEYTSTCGKSNGHDGHKKYDNLGNRDFSRRMCMPPIDVVYTWVNGSDAEWRSSMEYWRNIYTKLKYIEHYIRQNSSTNYRADNMTNIGVMNRSRCDTSVLSCNVSKSVSMLQQFFQTYDNTSNISEISNGTAPNSTKAFFSDLKQKVRSLLPENTIGTSNRYRDNHELKYSFRSLFKYAPWIRQVFLVTSGHIPNWLNTKHPRLKVLSHRDIWENKSYLPTFSSPAIETQLHNIPGLSKKFIYFNDDVLLGAPVWPEDFFSLSGIQKIYLSWDVPKCNPGCTDSWVGDGQCDLNCNVSRCLFDLGDCINVSKANAYGYRSGNSGSSGGSSRTWPYCSSGCPPTWIGDKVCDKKCDNFECGYDGGDCGIQVIYDNLEGFEIGTSKTARTEIFGDTFCRPYPNQSIPTILNLNFLEETCKNVLQPSAGFINCTLYTGAKDDLSITNVISHIEGANLSHGTPNVSDPGILKGHANVSRKHEEITKSRTPHAKQPATNDATTISAIWAPVGARAIYFNMSSLVPAPCYGSLNLEVVSAAHNNDVAIGGAVFLQYYKVFVILLRHETDPGLLKSKVEFEVKISLDRRLKDHYNISSENDDFMQIKKMSVDLFTNIGSGLSEDDLKPNSSSTGVMENNTLEQRKMINISVNSIYFGPNNSLTNNTMEKATGTEKVVKNAIKSTRTVSLDQNNRKRRRRLYGEDTYGDSLVKVNMLYNKEFGASSRKVPAHMPHLIDRDVIRNLHSHPTFKHEFEATSRRKFRSSHDMQYSFSYFHWLMHQKQKTDISHIFNEEIDTDGNGKLDQNEVRTLASMMLGASPNDQDIETLLANNCTSLTNIYDCKMAIEGIQKNVHQPKLYEKATLDEVTFQMVGDDVNDTRKMLDGIRGKRTKFICVNDDMKNPSNEVIQVLQNFFRALFPVPSPFELKDGIVNPILDIHAMRKLQGFQQKETLLRNMIVVLLCVVLIGVIRKRL